MARKFGSAAAFKTSLEAHLRKRADERKVPLGTLQLKFVIERLLARLFHNPTTTPGAFFERLGHKMTVSCRGFSQVG
jgi:hypothetical protein